MITVRGRELVIPVAERQIGTQFDNNSETRQFKINRLTVGGIDISNLDFRIDLRYGKETKDTDVLEKEITDEHVILTWTVSAASVKQVGTVFIALRGSDDFGTVKWATNQGYLYVGDTINTPDGAEMALSELEKLEKRIDQKTESMDAAESSRVEAEKIRQENESARLKNEAEWQKQGEAAVEAAKTATAAQSAASASAEAAAGSAGTAGSAAQTATKAASVASASAEAASGSAGTASSAAQTATTAQNAASDSAEAASGSAETASSAAQTATAAQSAASTSAEAAAGSAETASSAAQTATQKASEASSSASAAASDANVVKGLIQGLGGFDGKASSVSAVDLLGLLGKENATSTVQALIDVIADKVLNQLLLRSNVVNNALTTEEGYITSLRGQQYAQAAGQQAYDNYLSQLNDKSFDIYDRVYQQYLNEGQELYNRLNAVNNQDNIDYSRYRDSVNDYYNDLNYYAGRYDSSYNQDFGAYQTDLSAQQWAEQYAYQKTQDALAQQNWQTQFDYQKQQDALQLELQRQQLAASLAKKASGGSSGRSSKGSSKKSSSTSSDLAKYVEDAKRLIESKDGHGRTNYSIAQVIEYVADQYPSLTDSQIKKVITQAGGDYDKGLRILKQVTDTDK